MNDAESRLSALLQQVTPEPPRLLTAADVRGRSRSGRWQVVAAAAAVVLLVTGVAALARGGAERSGAPASGRCGVRGPGPATSGYLSGDHLLGPSDVSGTTYAWPPSHGQTSLISGINSSPRWQLLEVTERFADEATAQRRLGELLARRRCAPGESELHPTGSPSGTWFFQHDATNGYEYGWRQILTRVGVAVLQVEISAEDSAPADGPGEAFLTTVAVAARAKAAGRPAPEVSPLPVAVTAPPQGFLQLDDLGSGWSHSSDPSDNQVTTAADVPTTRCANLHLATSGPGRSVIYRGSQPLGDKEWLLNEEVDPLSASSVARARRAFESAAAGCPGWTVLFSGDQGSGSYAVALRPATDAGQATVYVVVGERLIVLTTLPGGASGQDVPLPGGTPWLEKVTRTAVERATSG